MRMFDLYFSKRLSCLFPDTRLTKRRLSEQCNAISWKYLSSSICTVVEESTHGYFCLGCFSSSTHFDLVIRLAQKVWRQCVLVFARGLGLRGGNCNGLLANTGLFLSTGNRYLFLLQRRLIPCDSFPRLQIQLLMVWNRFLLMNIQVVQFQYAFELIRFTYPSFVQSLQYFIG